MLPLVLLLLDYWPLGRLARPISRKGLRPLIAEKVPLFAVAAASAVVTFLARQSQGTVYSVSEVSVSSRIASVFSNYFDYVVKTFWPVHLGLLYPFHAVPAGKALAAFFVVACISIAALLTSRKRPYIIVGWLWFVVALCARERDNPGGGAVDSRQVHVLSHCRPVGRSRGSPPIWPGREPLLARWRRPPRARRLSPSAGNPGASSGIGSQASRSTSIPLL